MLDSTLSIACAVVAIVISGLGKGGFAGVGSLAMPVMALANPPVESAALMLPILIVQDVISVWSFRKTWDVTVLKVMMPGMTIGVILGYLFAARVSENSVLAVVGLLSVLFGLQRLWQERGHAMVLPSNSPKWVGVLLGAVSGFVSQIAHAGAPPFQMWVLPRRLDRDRLVGTTAISFAHMNWIKVPAYISLGQFTYRPMIWSLILTPLALGSTIAGVHLIRKFDTEAFYRVIYILMIAVGLKLVWDGLHA